MQNSELVQSVLSEVKGLLPLDLILVLASVAFIEGFQPLVSEAKKRIADHATRRSQKEGDTYRAKDLKQRVTDMESSSTLISSKLTWLKVKEAELLVELQKVLEAISSKTTRLERLLALIGQAEDEYLAFTHQAKLCYNISKSITCSDEDDREQIAEIEAFTCMW